MCKNQLINQNLVSIFCVPEHMLNRENIEEKKLLLSIIIYHPLPMMSTSLRLICSFVNTYISSVLAPGTVLGSVYKANMLDGCFEKKKNSKEKCTTVDEVDRCSRLTWQFLY